MKICIFIWGVLLLFSACHSRKQLMRNRVAFVAAQPVKTVVQETVRDTLVIEEKATSATCRTEKVEKTVGNELQHYCIILGSFIYEQNALNLRNSLIRKGFLGSSVMRNAEGMYRVSAECSDNYAGAWQELLRIRRTYPDFRDAWLLQTGEE